LTEICPLALLILLELKAVEAVHNTEVL